MSADNTKNLVSGSYLPFLTTLTIALIVFVGSGLLFIIQPFTAKLFTPLAGGSPTLWNICMVFFQIILLFGYALTHIITTRFKLKFQIIIISLILLIPFFFMPISLSTDSIPQDTEPACWFLGALGKTVGIPFLFLSLSAPLLQKWYSATSLKNAKDPYFLYSASNAGGLLGLLGYPFFIEPFLGIKLQSHLFLIGYGIFFIGVILSGIICYLLKDSRNILKPVARDIVENKPTLTTCLYWIILAFIPSGMAISVTHHLSTEIASIPLLWVLPLSIYLITYILAFSNKLPVTTATISNAMVILTLIVSFALLRNSNEPIVLVAGLHIAFLFIVGLLCHKLLDDTRPITRHLTIFYFMIALGGSLGGIFNALIAPLAFDSILEYPLLIALACYMRIDAKNNKDNKKKNSIFTSVLVPLLFGLWMIILIKILGYSDSFDIPSLLLRDILPLFLLYYLSSSTRIFAGSILVILVLANFYPSAHGEIIHASRTFFGVHRVTISPNKKFIQLIHGKTVHGLQNIANESKNLPTSYYHPSGPVGQVFTAMRKNKKQIKEVALIGLGVGSIAAFAKPGERFTFFEIDRAVIKIATNKQLFTFLSNSKAETRIIQGDGRVSIEQEPDKTYDILILDAFSSDSVPVHLLTTEAFNLYLNKLRPDGIMLLHVSSRYFSMQNVIAATLSATKSNLKIFYQEDEDINDEQRNEGKSVSAWMVAAQNQNVAGITEILTKDRKWQQLKPDNHNKCIWTDERSSIFDVLFPELYR